ncbi:MAG: glycosyltransferase, partial [Planctomycetaceae bacterium]
MTDVQLATPSTLGEGRAPPPAPRGKAAYLMSRFPKLTETFVLNEMQAVEREGWEVVICPLQRERTSVMHPDAEPYVRRAWFTPLLSWRFLGSHLRYLRRKPRVYLSTLWTLLRANFGSLRYFAGAVAFFPKAVHLARLLERGVVEHVHAHFASHPAMAALVIHRLTDIPFSFTAHGSDLHRDRHMLREKVAEASAVVAISRYNRNVILDECGEKYAGKVVVIHCGVDVSVFQPRSGPTPFDRGDGPLNVLCIGSLHEVKGQTHLIDACRRLRERGVEFTCHLVGDGPDRKRLQWQIERAGLTERVHLHGGQPREQVRRRLQSADVLAAPSVPSRDGRREGIPVVLMEAMASGVPVVASDLSGIPELAEHGTTGLLIPPGDSAALTDALRRLHDDAELRQALARNGRRRVEERFDLYQNARAL